MKNFDSRTYSINDFIEWSRNDQLVLNPKFQRRDVWTDRAKSFLMDTVVRGKPIPKVFIRQKINPTTKASIREVVDGQQRIRTILSYINDGFPISKRHNPQFGGYFFSQLGDIDPDIQTNILNYEISVDLLVNMPDAEVLDVFNRLNSYAVVLNDQEKLNASHFGPFKLAADELGHEYHEFWISRKVLTTKQVLRMGEIELVADMLIAGTEGIKSKKQIRSFYDQYEKEFTADPAALATRFRKVMSAIDSVFGDSLAYSEFRRIHLFYTLFTAFYHALFGLKGVQIPRPMIDLANKDRIMSELSHVDQIFATKEEGGTLLPEDAQFIDDSRRATTDAPVRTRRTQFVLRLLTNASTAHNS